MADVQIAIIDEQQTEITLAVPGIQGIAGPGVPAGGTQNQLFVKQSGVDYDAAWADDVDVQGTLDVTGDATFDQDVTIEGDLTVTGSITGGANAAPVILTDTTGVTGADQVTNIISLTQAEYDAIVSPNASTFYVITA